MIAELVPYANNARVHPLWQVEQIAKSITEWGWTIPILIDEAGGVIAGHGRILAAQKLGIESAPCMVARGWSEPKKRAYVLADNKLALNADWDLRVLDIELKALDPDLKALVGFNDADLASLQAMNDALGVTDAAAEWQRGGMPGFEQEDQTPFRTLIVHFPDAESVATFAEAIGQILTEKQKWTWYPEPKERLVLKDKRYAATEATVTEIDEVGQFIELCSRHTPHVENFREVIAALRSRKDGEHPPVLREFDAMEARWYASIAAGAPDWSVYAEPLYFCDIWYCWKTYSQKYLRQIGSLGIAETLFESGINSVLDLGCGIGYSTRALKALFPVVAGTNLADTPQFAMAAEIGAEAGFEVVTTPRAADLVFASEYFEHFERPAEHLREIIEIVAPRALLIANTFTSPSIGHFPAYRDGTNTLRGVEMSKAFNATLRAAGYVQQKTKMWNQRPALWRRE